MTNCPKCGRKLHIYNWRQECPDCHVNIVYYKSNDRLLEETEKAEIEHAKSQPGIDRAKAAFFGSPPAIIRIFISLLPIAGLFLPLCSLSGVNGAKSVNVINVVNFISGAEDIGSVFGNGAFGASIIGLTLSAVMIIVCLALTPLSLSEHGKERNIILNCVMIVSAAVSMVCFLICAADISAVLPGYSSAKLSVGSFVYIGLMLIIPVYNLMLDKRGLAVKYTPCYIGGLDSNEYFSLVEQGVDKLEIRRKMVEALTEIQERITAEEAKASEKKEAERAAWK